MRVSRRNISLLLSLLLLLFSITVTARADDDEDEYDVKARVVRLSFTDGEVNLKRNGNQDWERARLNYPLVEGDTVATGKDSRLEIQIDARNFLRLSANSALRLVTLRDEGIALSVVEGTAVVRLAKFDRSNEYFEIDAPKTTLAVEKTGLYRIDVPSDGRVRLTVRDGGTARIYSDTSGFTLRDGRSAELVVSGDTAGDWEFHAAASGDAIDDWVNDRERYLAQRQPHGSKYYDEYVWGAEELDAYGDWINTKDYGWIWRPSDSVLATYVNWAPYRHGHWTWCPPYGWTWVGYEPWGWAPYHYGRWVFYNNYWAWTPRSQFHRKRSWWRPALVAFVFDISFGNDICWYPLSYYHRDPYSRHYRHYDRRPSYGSGGGGRPSYGGGGHDRRNYDHDKSWRGVTRVPRKDFGNSEGRGRGIDDERVARRVIDSEPQPGGNMPRRDGVVENVPGGDGTETSGRPLRKNPVIHLPQRPTGAAERTPGVALDEDLRRSRVFRGRDPRATEPVETPSTSTPETRPTGAVVRPEPSRPRRDDSIPPDAPRVVRPIIRDDAEKSMRGRQRIESQPRNAPEARNTAEPSNAPEPRNEQPAPVSQPETRSEPRSEIVRPQPRFEPRSEPRAEPRESRPERRSEPRAEPRESRPETRSESPRIVTPRSESPRSESPRSESPRSESPRSESPRSERPQRSEPPPRSDPPPQRSESPRSSPPPRSDPPPQRSEPPPRNDPPPRSEAPRSDPPRSDPPKSDPPKSDPPRSDPPRSDPPRSESPKSDPPRPDRPDRP